MLTIHRINEPERSYSYFFQPNIRQSITVGELTLSTDTGRANVFEVPLLLRPTEFRLLHFFMTNVELVQTRADLLKKVWEKDGGVGERTVDVHIRRLRASLEPFGLDRWIQTVHTRGYRFSSTQH